MLSLLEKLSLSQFMICVLLVRFILFLLPFLFLFFILIFISHVVSTEWDWKILVYVFDCVIDLLRVKCDKCYVCVLKSVGPSSLGRVRRVGIGLGRTTRPCV